MKSNVQVSGVVCSALKGCMQLLKVPREWLRSATTNTLKTLLSRKLEQCTAQGWQCPPPFFLASKKMGQCHQTHIDGAPLRVGWCTPSVVVRAPTQLSLDQVQVGTTLGVVVPPNRVVVPLGQPDALSFLAGHRHRGGGAPLEHPKPSFASFSSPFSPPLQIC
jgi:hypothetical protein